MLLEILFWFRILNTPLILQGKNCICTLLNSLLMPNSYPSVFFTGLRLPKVADEQRLKLNAPITREVVLLALKYMPSGKAPGPDGFGWEFYKEFSHIHSFEIGILPQSPTSGRPTSRSFLKKENCASYRPNFKNFGLSLRKSSARFYQEGPNWFCEGSPAGFIYLGIHVTPTFSQVFKSNYPHLLNSIKADLDHWAPLPLPRLGRIALIKMNVLPRLLYPLQTIPLLLSNKVIKVLEGWPSSITWSKRRPRFKMIKLQMPGWDGGLDVPNVRFYQLASHLQVITSWYNQDPASTLNEIESFQSKCPLVNLLFVNDLVSVKKILFKPYHPEYHQSLETHSLVGRPGRVNIPYYYNYW